MERIEALLASREQIVVPSIHMQAISELLRELPDEHLVYALRVAIVDLSIRMAGDSPSFEGSKSQVPKVFKAIKESFVDELNWS